MAGGAIPGIFSLVLDEDEIAELSSMPCEHAESNTAALYILSRFFVGIQRCISLTLQREEMEKLATITAEPFGTLRLTAESTWVQTFVDDWTKRWCTPTRSEIQRWYLRFIAISGQLVISCRILRHMAEDRHARVILKQDITRLAINLLDEAHTRPAYLPTLNHSVALPFAALLVLMFSSRPPDVVTRCALRFAGDPSKPSATLPTFGRFNAEQMMAIV
jgi:hypothetical protein